MFESLVCRKDLVSLSLKSFIYVCMEEGKICLSSHKRLQKFPELTEL